VPDRGGKVRRVEEFHRYVGGHTASLKYGNPIRENPSRDEADDVIGASGMPVDRRDRSPAAVLPLHRKSVMTRSIGARLLVRS